MQSSYTGSARENDAFQSVQTVALWWQINHNRNACYATAWPRREQIHPWFLSHSPDWLHHKQQCRNNVSPYDLTLLILAIWWFQNQIAPPYTEYVRAVCLFIDRPLILSTYFDAWHCRILVVLGSETIEHLSAPIAGTPNYQSFDREENASRPPQYDAPQQQYQQNQQNQPPPYGSNNVMSPNGGQQVSGLLHSSFHHKQCLSPSADTSVLSLLLSTSLHYPSFSVRYFAWYSPHYFSLISLSCVWTEPGNSQHEASPGETLPCWRCIMTITTL